MRDSTTSAASVTVHPSAAAVVSFGPFRFDPNNQILARDGDEIRLPPRAVAILDMLLERSEIVPRTSKRRK